MTSAEQLLSRYENLQHVKTYVGDHLKTELKKPSILLGLGAAAGVAFLQDPYFISMAGLAALDGVRNYFAFHPDEFESLVKQVQVGGTTALTKLPVPVQKLVLLMVKLHKEKQGR